MKGQRLRVPMRPCTHLCVGPLTTLALLGLAGCATEAHRVDGPECRIQLGSTPATASAEARRQDAVAARAALAQASLHYRANLSGGLANSAIDELLWECERAAEATRD